MFVRARSTIFLPLVPMWKRVISNSL